MTWTGTPLPLLLSMYICLSLQSRSIQILPSERHYQTISIQHAITLQICILRGTCLEYWPDSPEGEFHIFSKPRYFPAKLRQLPPKYF